ncbi:SAM domain-containing protein SAMSN-1 isoform X2 [Arvicanthis niloticus]|uniref:SAM domain-containing protein SAMSN-1 isoform X2 n=1 Tax=Arvicanthis niloticus TaxID=61156 RepID=UPI001485F61B|nr:SAM domain-containing protein SAMSN-1 isoform X2 [Arvicanthis niloticus]
MNLFCFSLEGSMESIYEPIPQQAKQESTCSRREETGQAFNKLGVEVSNFEAETPKRKTSFQKLPPEDKIFEGTTVYDTTWQEPSKAAHDCHLRRPWQLTALINEDGLLLRRNKHIVQEKESQGTPYQAIKSGGDPLGSARTLNRLQKWLWIRKARVPSLQEGKPVLIDPRGEDTLLSCVKLTKSQEKKDIDMVTRKRKKLNAGPESLSASRSRTSISNGHNQKDTVSPYDIEVPVWKNWKPFPENPFWTSADFPIAQVGHWSNCFSCQHLRLKASYTDMDLLSTWRSSSFGNFDRFRNNSMSKSDDSIKVHDGELTNGSEEQSKTLSNGGSLGKKVRAISWTMKKKVGKKYIKALSEEKEEESGEEALQYRNSDPMIGTHTEKISLKASDSLDSLYSGQSSSSGITSCSDGTSNRDSFRLDDDSPYSGPFCGRAKVHTDFTPSPYDTDSLKIKKGDIIDIICKTPMGMWTGMLNNKVGNFKFIYVDVISEEEAAPKKIKVPRSSRRENPQTLQEFLERIHLQEYTSTLLLNGYETLDDLKDIKESHLIELNIANPEDRARLLSAAESLLDEETAPEHEKEPVSLSSNQDIIRESQVDDCPRDSGCYISSGNSDNGKEDLESENLPDMVQKIAITEPSD